MNPDLSCGSLFSGIEGFGLGFEQAGFKIKWQVENDKFCRKILQRHWPQVPKFDDVRRVCGLDCFCEKDHLEKVNVITAGVPCQDWSIAGQRRGIKGKRSGLVYEFARILRELRPTWFVFENVPGLFSSNQGRDFAEVLRLFMVECGYGVSWRVLDSRYFGVAQRRRRVFIVGYLGVPCPGEILFETTCSERNFAQSTKARTDIAIALTSGTGVTGKGSGRRQEDDFNIVQQAISAKWAKGSSGPSGNDSSDRNGGPPNLVTNIVNEKRSGEFQQPAEEVDGAMFGDDTNRSAADSDRMRDFAGLPKGMDSPRYRAIGNAVTVSVAYWIAQRIYEYEKRRTSCLTNR